MANTNAMVEKLKDFGIRHGEKAGVGVAAALFVLCFVVAIQKPTIDLTADQVQNDAKQADQNLTKPQAESDILAKLERDGLKDQGFEKKVDETSSTSLDATQFAFRNPWITPEPGAGRIRDTPELIAPTDLYARAGRGGALVFDLDENGDKKVLVKAEVKKKPSRKRGRRRSSGGGSSGYGSMMAGGSGMGGAGTKSAADEEKEKKEYSRKQKALKEALVGNVDTSTEKEEEKSAEKQDFVEVTRGLRWVAITGTLDNKKLRENYAAALKTDYASVYPNYQRLDVERQMLQDDGSWTDWELVNYESNQKILQNIPEADEELTPDDVRLANIDDTLPFLRAGKWKGVHVASLVPKEKRDIAKPEPKGGMGYGGYGSSAMGSSSDYASMMSGAGGGSSSMAGASSDYASMMAGSSSGMMMGSSGGGMGASMSAAENTDFPHTEAATVMVRSLDFTVEPNTTYRFRARIVVMNPNKSHENVAPGVDTKSDELTGPWSEPTEAVTMPSDVTAYAMSKTASGANGTRGDLVHFMVARFNPKDGLTVYKTYDAGPGQILGDPRRMRVPVLDDNEDAAKKDEATKLEPIEFCTRQMVLDTAGGTVPAPKLPGIIGSNCEVPALAVMLRPDGSIAVRDEAFDSESPERKEVQDNFDAAMDEATERDKSNRKPSGNPYGGGSSSSSSR